MWRPRDLARICLVVLLAAGCAARRPPATPARPAGGLWIRDVTLVSPERDAPLPHAHVLLQGGRIAWVGSAPPGHDVAASATAVDGAGRYPVPGLMDGHVHLAEVPGLSRAQAAALPKLVESYFRQPRRSYLYFGFTTVVDLNVVDRPRVDRIRAAPVGPAVFDCGNALVLANGYPMAYAPSPERFALFPNFLHDPRQADSIPASSSPRPPPPRRSSSAWPPTTARSSPGNG